MFIYNSNKSIIINKLYRLYDLIRIYVDIFLFITIKSFLIEELLLLIKIKIYE